MKNDDIVYKNYFVKKKLYDYINISNNICCFELVQENWLRYLHHVINMKLRFLHKLLNVTLSCSKLLNLSENFSKVIKYQIQLIN